MKKTDIYSSLTERNIGLLSNKQQQILKKSTVAVLGLGGLGGIVCEILARSGVGKIKILDNDSFEKSNLNRQIFSFISTLEKNKVDITEKFLLDINPELKIEKFYEVNEQNINQILNGCSIVVLALDSIKECIIISREAKKQGIPLVESWAIPYSNVRVIDKNTPSLEECYNLPTKDKLLSGFSDKDFAKMKISMIEELADSIDGVKSYYSLQSILKMKFGKIPLRSFAPMVWLTSVTMALESIKVMLHWGDISYAPKFRIYDPFKFRILEFKR